MATSSGAKRKIELQTLETKYHVLKEIENGRTRLSLCKEFNLKANTVCGWIAKADQIKKKYEDRSVNSNAKKLRLAKNPDLEKAIYSWYRDAITKSPSSHISRTTLTQKAEEFAEKLGIVNFTPSNGWFSRFKHRYGLGRKQNSEDGESAGVARVEDWETRLRNIMASYGPSDIYNAGETSLFYKCMPSCSSASDSSEWPENKLNILVAANKSARHKVLMIGKKRKAGAQQQESSSDTRIKQPGAKESLFAEWLQWFDRRMAAQNRKVCLIVGHFKVKSGMDRLKAVELVYPTPNSSSFFQPMDLGIMENVKMFYRRAFVEKQMAHLEYGENFNINVFGAMHILKKAWESVKADTIKKCFELSFSPNAESESASLLETSTATTQDDEDFEPYTNAGLSLTEYDNCCETAGTDEEAEYCTQSNVETILEALDQRELLPTSVNSKAETAEEKDAIQVPTDQQAAEALQLIRRYALMNNKNMLQHINHATSHFEEGLSDQTEAEEETLVVK